VRRLGGLLLTAALGSALTGAVPGQGARAAGQPDPHPHDHHHADARAHDDTNRHVHAPVPPEYRGAHVPAAAWTDAQLLARGKEIYADRCAVCHGDTGDGKGPAGLALPLRPPDLRDRRMVGEMAGNYWFWRVSEGGAVEPFRSMGSTMPSWKDELSVEDRWAVIAYQHAFSGHRGPHVTSEHPDLVPVGGVPPAATEKRREEKPE
jgi:mono/diheme cytochrome c family protein